MMREFELLKPLEVNDKTIELAVSIDYHWMSYIHCKTNKLHYFQQVRNRGEKIFYDNDG